MRPILEDIRERLRQAVYKNEEHVRICIVARILQALGWDIWNPLEVNAEYGAAPREDSTRVDFALFASQSHPMVFVEVKRLGQAENQLPEIERQLRDYNRNNTAPFSVITDGRLWWLYYSQTGGEFHDKQFARIDILDEEIESVAVSLDLYLAKGNIVDGTTEGKAKELLRLSQEQRAFSDCVPEARRRVQEPPFPAMPDAVVELMTLRGFGTTRENAIALLSDFEEPTHHWREETHTVPVPLPPPPVGETDYEPDNPPDLRFTVVDSAKFGDRSSGAWNDLVQVALRCAHSQGFNIPWIRQAANVHIVEERRTDAGFRPVSDTPWSYQNVQSDRAWRIALQLARALHQSVEVHFRWRATAGAAHPNQRGLLHWRQ